MDEKTLDKIKQVIHKTPKDYYEELARSLHSAARRHAFSWDKDSEEYLYTIKAACHAECKPEIEIIACILLSYAWNDSLDWADEILGFDGEPRSF